MPAARRLVRDHLRDCGQPHFVDDAELLVSELVGNVVLHVGGTVAVRAHATPAELLLEVTNTSPVTPQLRAFSATSGTGRGMRLVHSLSAEHGVRLTDHGKTIWVRLTPATASRADDELAVQFAGVDWLADLTDVPGLPEPKTMNIDRSAPAGRPVPPGRVHVPSPRVAA